MAVSTSTTVAGKAVPAWPQSESTREGERGGGEGGAGEVKKEKESALTGDYGTVVLPVTMLQHFRDALDEASLSVKVLREREWTKWRKGGMARLKIRETTETACSCLRESE